MKDKEDFPRSLEEIRTIVRESLPEKYDRMANTWTHVSGDARPVPLGGALSKHLKVWALSKKVSILWSKKRLIFQ